ncbi:MAG: hypothetical protein V3R29_01970 [Candidatus Acidoferrales bacterium]
MSNPLMEIAEFAGKASGTIVKDVADFSRPLADAFRRGWREAMEEKPKTEPAAKPAPDSA